MDKEKILECLAAKGLNDAEPLKEEEGFVLVRFYYDFDDDELEAAEAYANDEAGKEKNYAWTEEFYLPYLNELAVDNVGEIIEEITEQMGIKAQFLSFEMDADDDYCEFAAVFYEEGRKVNLEEILDDLNS